MRCAALVLLATLLLGWLAPRVAAAEYGINNLDKSVFYFKRSSIRESRVARASSVGAVAF